MWIKYNANPTASRVGDCTVRAISKAMGKTWEETYLMLAIEGLLLHDMPSSNYVWMTFLKREGFNRSTCRDCCTVRQFAEEHPDGTYILALSGHVVACCDSCYFDTWDSGDEIVLSYLERR